MKSLFKRIWKVKITILVLIFASLLITSPSTNAGLWSKKIKKISDNELREIKTELNISGDPRFHSYRDSDLKRALNKEMDPKKAEGLTYGLYILTAINEENLVNLCSKSAFNDKEATRFFSMLTEDLASWQKNFAEKTTKLAIQGVIEACRMSGLSSGISSVFLVWDLARINISIKELEKVIRNRALWHYIASRKMGDSHEGAWGSAPVPIKYRNKQTEEYFKSLWNKYGDHVLDSGLDSDFKMQQHEILKTSLLYALGAKAHLVINYPLKITPPPYHQGDKIEALFGITNKGNLPILLKTVTVGGRYGEKQEVVDFPHKYGIYLDMDESYTYHGYLTLPKVGKYHFFCTYQTPDGKWNTSIDLASWLNDQDRVKDITVKAPEVTYPNRIVDILSLDKFEELKSQKKIKLAPKYICKFDEKASSLSIIREADNTTIALVKIPPKIFYPSEKAITPDGEYTCILSKEPMPIIRTSDNKIVKTISVAAAPSDKVLTPDGKYEYIIKKGAGGKVWEEYDALVIRRTSDNTVVKIIKDYFSARKELWKFVNIRKVAMRPDGKYVYAIFKELYTPLNIYGRDIGTIRGGLIAVIRTSDHKIVSIIQINAKKGWREFSTSRWKWDKEICSPPLSNIVITPDGKYLYAITEKSANSYFLYIIRTSDNKIVSSTMVLCAPLTQRLTWYNISNDGKYIFASTSNITTPKNFGLIIRVSDGTIIGKTENKMLTDHSVVSLVGISPDENYAYFLRKGENVRRGAIMRFIKDQRFIIEKLFPNGLAKKIYEERGVVAAAMTPNKEYIYMTKLTNKISLNKIFIMRTSNNKVIDTIYMNGPILYWDAPYMSSAGRSFFMRGRKWITFDSSGKHAYVIYKGFCKGHTKNTIRVAMIGSGECFPNTIIDTISVEHRPQDIAITPDGECIYIVNQGSNSVSVIRTSDNSVERRIWVEKSPSSIAITPNGKLAYVTNSTSKSISVIQTIDNTVIDRISVEIQPIAIAITPDGKHAYVCGRNGTILVIRTLDNTVIKKISTVGKTIHGIAITPDGKYVYVAGEEGISVIKTSINKVLHVVDIPAAGEIVITPDGEHAYVCASDEKIKMIKVRDNTVEKIYNKYFLPEHPRFIAITPDTKYIYVAGPEHYACNYQYPVLSVIQTSDNTVIDTIYAYGIGKMAITPNGKFLYVISQYEDKVYVIKSVSSEGKREKNCPF